ncbi:cardioacceleratory peptide receptor-like [Mytilus trossulus]|uniref:cardioacceleratory peptide receptor-like n=1 Tax=Mytilus trossulus TaxID=6551 RepID=UPI003007D732
MSSLNFQENKSHYESNIISNTCCTTTDLDTGIHYHNVSIPFPVIDNLTKWLSVAILAGIIVFNTLVIMLLFRTKKKSRMGFFVQNLAIADLCVGLIYSLPEVLAVRFDVGWEEHICYIFKGINMFPIYVSTFAIVTLSLDRLYVIIRPVSSIARGRTYRFCLVILCWIAALFLSIPGIIYVKYDKEQSVECFYDAGQLTKLQLMIDINFNLTIPALIIGTCYTCIVITIWKRERSTYLEEGTVTSRRATNIKSDRSKKLRCSNVIAKAKIKTIKLLFVVVTAYIVCWTPVCVGTSLLVWGKIEYGTTYKLLYVLAPLNSLVNPLVFLLFNRKMFKENVKTLKKIYIIGTFTASFYTHLSSKSSTRLSGN